MNKCKYKFCCNTAASMDNRQAIKNDKLGDDEKDDKDDKDMMKVW